MYLWIVLLICANSTGVCEKKKKQYNALCVIAPTCMQPDLSQSHPGV